MGKRDKIFILLVVVFAIVAVLCLTMFIPKGNSNKNEKELVSAEVDKNIGDPGQTVPKEKSVDPPNEEYVDVDTRVEALPQDADEASQEDLEAYWNTLVNGTSSYEKVKAYDMLLTGFRNMLLRGETPELINKFPIENGDSSGFDIVSVESGNKVLDLYSIVLPSSATLSNSRANILVVLRDENKPVYSEYLSKKDSKFMEGAIALGDRGIVVYGPVLDQNYGTDSQAWFVKGIAAGTASTEPISIKYSQSLGTIVIAETDGTLLLKSGVDGIFLTPKVNSSELQFVCSDGSETLSIVGEMDEVYTKIITGETAVQEPSGQNEEDLLEDVEIPQFH